MNKKHLSPSVLSVTEYFFGIVSTIYWISVEADYIPGKFLKISYLSLSTP